MAYNNDQFMELMKGVKQLSGANLAGMPPVQGEIFPNVDLSKANLTDASFWSCDFIGADLSGSNSYSTNFWASSLNGADLSGAFLRCADFSQADLSNANLTGAVLTDAVADSNTKGIDLNWWASKGGIVADETRRSMISKIQAGEKNLRGVDLHGARLVGTTNTGTVVQDGTKIGGCDLSGVDFTGANLCRVDFSGSNLSGAVLYGANLFEANFTGANLSGVEAGDANLYKANFGSANLSNADLMGAFLMSADFRSTILQKTNFERADLTDIIYISDPNSPEPILQLNGSTIDRRTRGIEQRVWSGSGGLISNSGGFYVLSVQNTDQLITYLGNLTPEQFFGVVVTGQDSVPFILIAYPY